MRAPQIAVFLAALAALALVATGVAPPTAQVRAQVRARALVVLVTLGTFPADLADAVEQGLRAELQVEVRRDAAVALPRTAYYPPRHRYRADRLLTFFGTRYAAEPQTTRILGMTNVDISTTKGSIRDWGVFGLGDLGGRACVISSFRLQRRARDAAHLRFRIVTTAIHEIGHTLGLDHCTETACVMRDAEGSIVTVDTGDGHVHPECRAELDRESPVRLLQ